MMEFFLLSLSLLVDFKTLNISDRVSPFAPFAVYSREIYKLRGEKTIFESLLLETRIMKRFNWNGFRLSVCLLHIMIYIILITIYMWF